MRRALSPAGRRWLAWSAPVVAAALVAAGVLLGVTLGNAYARDAYDDGRPGVAAERYDHQRAFTPAVIEPWKAWFNTGTAHLRAGAHLDASGVLRGALDRVPAGTAGPDGEPDPQAPECRVRNNLSLALEHLGDAAADAGDQAAALTYYEDAMDAIGPCTSDGESATSAPPGPTETAPDQTEARQREKADAAQQDAEPGPGTDPEETEQEQQEQQGPPAEDVDPEQPSEEPTEAAETPDPRQRELEQRNREAEQDRQEQEQRSGGGTGSGQSW